MLASSQRPIFVFIRDGIGYTSIYIVQLKRCSFFTTKNLASSQDMRICRRQ